jgi:hypothetical protein
MLASALVDLWRADLLNIPSFGWMQLHLSVFLFVLMPMLGVVFSYLVLFLATLAFSRPRSRFTQAERKRLCYAGASLLGLVVVNLLLALFLPGKEIFVQVPALQLDRLTRLIVIGFFVLGLAHAIRQRPGPVLTNMVLASLPLVSLFS